MTSDRIIAIWTPNYGIKNFKIIYDSGIPCRFKNHLDAIEYYENKKAEDADLKLIYASAKISNEEILYTYNCTMELSTDQMVNQMLNSTQE